MGASEWVLTSSWKEKKIWLITIFFPIYFFLNLYKVVNRPNASFTLIISTGYRRLYPPKISHSSVENRFDLWIPFAYISSLQLKMHFSTYLELTIAGMLWNPSNFHLQKRGIQKNRTVIKCCLTNNRIKFYQFCPKTAPCEQII